VDLNLADRTILVTGGSTGVGFALVGLLAAEGANIIACARDEERLTAAIARLGDLADRVAAVACDVQDRAAVEHLVMRGADRFGGIDGVVNNAGRAQMKSLSQLTDSDWPDEFKSKFGGVLNTLGATRKLLADSPVGSIVMINATLSRQPDPRLIATGAARAALFNFTKALALELAPENIRVNSVCLGLIDTGQWARRYAAAQTDQDYDSWLAGIAADRGIPLGRLGRAEEVAAAVAFLLSPLSSYTTGTSLDVCGGLSGRHG
jgi:NAD(P)-dependent dehydrogenase (short-subunit alcohol dehydrogenase family)